MKTSSIILPGTLTLGDESVELDLEVQFHILEDGDIELTGIYVEAGEEVTELFPQDVIIRIQQQLKEGII